MWLVLGSPAQASPFPSGFSSTQGLEKPEPNIPFCLNYLS